jgi:hypothetical protein
MTIIVYARSGFLGLKRTLIFQYDPVGETLPVIEADKDSHIVIRIGELSSIVKQIHSIENVAIEYDIGRMRHP